MSASVILISTVLAVLVVLAIALLTGSIALLAGAQDGPHRAGGLRSALRLLDRQWQIERLIYRHHRLFGILVLAAGTFFLWQMTRTELAPVLASGSTTATLLWVLLLGQGFNLLVGLVIFLRPSLLKPVETLSNRWHSLEAKDSNRPTSPRLAALLLALVGLIVLLGAATLLLKQMAPFFG